MTPTEARYIIEALAQGVDPETGEVLLQYSLLQRPGVIRALFCAAQAAVECKKEPAEPNSPSGNAGSACSSPLTKAPQAEQLAQAHGRSKGGIASRPVRLGRDRQPAGWVTLGLREEVVRRKAQRPVMRLALRSARPQRPA